jgi:hypothetical protein
MTVFKPGPKIFKSVGKKKLLIPAVHSNLPGSPHPQPFAPAEDETVDLSEYKDQLTKAVLTSVWQWEERAWLYDVNITVEGPVVSSGEQVLKGPHLGNLVIANSSFMRGDYAQVRMAIAEAVQQCFTSWQDHVSIPDIPMYPGFLLYAGSYATPTPCQPVNLSLWRSSNYVGLSSNGMDLLLKHYVPAKAPTLRNEPWVLEVCAYFAWWWGLALPGWLASRKVTGLLGYGPVPSYNPPLVRAGPVKGRVAGASLKISKMTP